jgi:cytochrome c-type biogenesis protein CcmH/NrfG
MKNLFLTALFSLIYTFLPCANAQTYSDGLAAMQLKEWDKAAGILSGLTKTNPADQAVFLSLGSVYIAKGESGMAQKAFESAFSAKSEGPLALVALGRQALLKNDYATADQQFARAAKSGKKDMVVLRLIGESFLFAPPGVKPNFARAEEKLKAALEVNSKDMATIMSLGYCYKEMPNGGLAAQQYELAEGLEPNSPRIKFMLARVYKAANLPSRFVTMCEKALTLNPRYTPALRALSDYYYFDHKGAGKWEKALEWAQKLVDNADDPIIEDEMVLANCLFINKKYPECSAAVEKIIAKDASKNYLRRLLAYTSYETGDYARCLSMLNDYFKIAPADKILWTDFKYLGESTLKTKGDTMAAIGQLKKAIEMDTSGQAWIYNKNIGDLLYNRKNYCNARSAYQLYIDSIFVKSEENTKAQALDYYQLGLSQLFCKEDTLGYIPAEESFKKVMEMAPNSTLGPFWAGRCAENRDPKPAEIEADPEKAKAYGKALPYYEAYLKLADKEKNKKEMPKILRYVSYCYFVAENAEKFNPAVDLWAELAPDDTTPREMKLAFEEEQKKKVKKD